MPEEETRSTKWCHILFGLSLRLCSTHKTCRPRIFLYSSFSFLAVGQKLSSEWSSRVVVSPPLDLSAVTTAYPRLHITFALYLYFWWFSPWQPFRPLFFFYSPHLLADRLKIKRPFYAATKKSSFDVKNARHFTSRILLISLFTSVILRARASLYLRPF